MRNLNTILPSLIFIAFLIFISSLLCCFDKEQEPLPFNGSLQKLLLKNNSDLTPEVSNFEIKFGGKLRDTTWFIRIIPCLEVSAIGNCVFFKNPLPCQRSESFSAVMVHYFPKDKEPVVREFPSGGDGVVYFDSIYSFICFDSITADSIVYIINEIKKISSTIHPPSSIQLWINGIFDNWEINVLGLFLFCGPLIPTVFILFFKRFRKDKLTLWVFALQWLIYFVFYMESKTSLSAFGVIAISLLILVFDLIYLPVKLILFKIKPTIGSK